MKITVTKVKKILQKDYGWENLDIPDHEWFVKELIKDTIKVIDEILKEQKGISITNKQK